MKTNLKSAAIYVSVFALGGICSSIVVNVSAQKPEELWEEPVMRNTLRESDAESLLSIIMTEGMHNAFSHYSTYRDIGDGNFHTLRKQYIAASEELMRYISEAARNDQDLPYTLSCLH